MKNYSKKIVFIAAKARGSTASVMMIVRGYCGIVVSKGFCTAEGLHFKRDKCIQEIREERPQRSVND